MQGLHARVRGLVVADRGVGGGVSSQRPHSAAPQRGALAQMLAGMARAEAVREVVWETDRVQQVAEGEARHRHHHPHS